MSALAFAIQAFNVIPGLVAAGMDIYEFVSKASDDLKKMQDENRDPTDQEWADLNKVIEDLRAQRPDVGGE